MQSEPTYLARCGRFRHVTLTSPQTVQIQWDNVALSWQRHDFDRFAQILQRQLAQQALPQPTVQLRINRVSVGLPTADFHEFAEMVLHAWTRLGGAERPSPPPRPTQTTCPTIGFSVN